MTTPHVAVSLASIATGFAAMIGMLRARRLPRWTVVFPTTALATTGGDVPLPAASPAV